jgi:hypothetical protein
MSEKKTIYLWNTRAKTLARVWLCGQCGAKIYCGRPVERPNCRCLCGKASWQDYETCRRYELT